MPKVYQELLENTSPAKSDRLLADMRHLLTEAKDADYLIGQSAVEAWAESIAASEEGVTLGDPGFQSLSAIGKLAVASQRQLAGYGVPVDVARLDSVCSQLAQHGRAALSGTIIVAAECETDWENRQQQLAKDFAKLLNEMAKCVSVYESSELRGNGGLSPVSPH